MAPLVVLLLSASTVLSGCGDGVATRGGHLPDPATFALRATSDRGMVVSGNPYATHAGAEILGVGGNAVDAAVATAFALAVVEPSQSGLGGRTQALVGLPDGSFHGVDGTTQVPMGYDAATAPSVERGYPTVAIPGTVKALTRLLAEDGSMSLEQVLGPAIRYAEGGFPLTPGEARRIAGVAEDLRAFPEAGRTFLKEDGSPYEGGDTLVQGELAEVLKTLAREGADAFYSGEIARRMVEDFQANGGYVTLEDLAGYEARDAVLARGSYRGADLVGTYLPASGATVIEILQIMERFPVGGMTEGERAALLTQALLLGFQDRDEFQFDPPETVVARLTSKEWARERARMVRGVGDVGGGANSARGAGSAGEGGPSPEWAHTTHVAVADDQGMVVAMTQSLGPTLGSWVVTPGLGFVYAATTGGYLADAPPGGRPWSSQAPLIVLEDGVPRFVLGGAGARRIVSGLVSVVSRLLDQGMGLQEAMAAPRLHPSGSTVTVEAADGRDASTDQVEAALEGLGFQVEIREFSTWFALLNAVEIRPDEGGGEPRFLGVADPRWGFGGAGGPPEG
jgi:gamma-glutamyltranspeptidase/glutathione hydrolase